MKRRVFVSILLLALVLSAFSGQAFADSKYQVRVFGGNSDIGVLSKAPEDVGYQDTYTFPIKDVTVKDERYYVRGFREAGKDNSDYIYTTSSLPIERDMDYVVAYGMKGFAVEYTVNFVDADGKELAPSQTFYGNVKDRPVVSYVYIEGYQPQAYALTKTLTDNPANNVFNFTYTEVEPITTTTTVVVGGGGGGAVLPVGNAGVQPAQPEEIIDLDTPLAGPDAAESGPVLGMHGDWKATATPSMSEEATAAFEKATEGSEGVKYEPVACLAQKEVSGTNYEAILCKVLEDKPDAEPYYAIAYVKENPEGNEILNIVSLTRDGEIDEKAGEVKDDWKAAEEQEPGVNAFKKAAANLLGAVYKPVYVLSSQGDSGKDYCVLVRAKTVAPGAEPYYTLATVHEDASGDVKITEFRNFDVGAIFEETTE